MLWLMEGPSLYVSLDLLDVSMVALALKWQPCFWKQSVEPNLVFV